MTVAPTLGVRADGSLGVVRYVDRLAAALTVASVAYAPSRRGRSGVRLHFHLANSSRAVALHAPAARTPYLLTVHDVLPRTRALKPLYRAFVYPFCVRGAGRVVVHSAFAADLLVAHAGVPYERIAVVPHPAPVPVTGDRSAARSALGIPAGPPLFVLPGIVTGAKLAAEVVDAARPLLRAGVMRLALVGRVRDHGAVAAARVAGALVVTDPTDWAYECAVVAADAVLCVRRDSVGETNGPLLDAIGAGRAVLATPSGSIPEVAGGCARMVAPTVAGLRAGMEALLDEAERTERERAARLRAGELSWAASARAHADLLDEVYGG